MAYNLTVCRKRYSTEITQQSNQPFEKMENMFKAVDYLYLPLSTSK